MAHAPWLWRASKIIQGLQWHWKLPFVACCAACFARWVWPQVELMKDDAFHDRKQTENRSGRESVSISGYKSISGKCIDYSFSCWITVLHENKMCLCDSLAYLCVESVVARIFAFLWKCRLLYFCSSYFPSIFYSLFPSFPLSLLAQNKVLSMLHQTPLMDWMAGRPESHWEHMSCVWYYWETATARWLQTILLLFCNLYLHTVGWQSPTYAYTVFKNPQRRYPAQLIFDMGSCSTFTAAAAVKGRSGYDRSWM